MRHNPNATGHILALLTILIWGTTFISTKMLLRDFSPVEILFFRFLLGLIALTVILPSPLKLKDKRHHLLFIGAGLCGITFYYLLENIALTMSTASNVGVIITVAPFFTALLACRFLKTEKPGMRFYLGFVTALLGIALISFNGQTALKLNPLGDLLALLAAVAWAGYSIFTKKIGNLGYPTIKATRRIFLYGLICMLPFLYFMDFEFRPERFVYSLNLFNILFLGLGASALCFVTWNTALKLLGAVKTSVYIYLVPIVTVVTAVIILKEPLTTMLILGALLTLLGLWLSETKFAPRSFFFRKKHRRD